MDWFVLVDRENVWSWLLIWTKIFKSKVGQDIKWYFILGRKRQEQILSIKKPLDFARGYTVRLSSRTTS